MTYNDYTTALPNASGTDEANVDAGGIGEADTEIADLDRPLVDPAGSETADAAAAALSAANRADDARPSISAHARPNLNAPDHSAPDPIAKPLSTLEARSISTWFGDHKVLESVSLIMPAGEVTALIGPSGCGKSTFLRTLNRMHELTKGAALAGEVLLDGQDVYDPKEKTQRVRADIGMVFQRPNPFPAMSIYDNVLAGFKLTGLRIAESEKEETVYRALTSAGLWKEVKNRLKEPGGGLSGGQQQRLCIARSIAIKPKVLLMDEPCSALDPTSTRVIEETMGELQKEVTIVIVTHNMSQAQRVSKKCAFFLASQGTPGVIVEHGDTEAMFSQPLDERTYDYVNGRFG